MLDFFKGFWTYISTLLWWQGAIIIIAIVFIFVLGKFGKNLLGWFREKLQYDRSGLIQYRMFWGLSNDALNIKLKDEIRRSFKENGFDGLSGNEFAQYVKNQHKILVTILKNHIINLYPTNRRVIVSMDEVLEYIDSINSKLEDVFFELYIESKRIKKQDEQILKEIDEKFETEIETFIKRKKNENDCKSCLVVLFGKREIAENKKSKIKTLRGQMNFAEQKLSEIHSQFLTFYSEKLSKK